MPEETVQSFVNTFARLPQRVIWQWSGKPHKNNLPKNVLVLPWLPQQDLLGIWREFTAAYLDTSFSYCIFAGHHKCRAFITHGGLNSIQEAIYHQVPILGLPFSTDQRLNMLRATSDGYGLRLDWNDLDSEKLLSALHILLHNSRYKKYSWFHMIIIQHIFIYFAQLYKLCEQAVQSFPWSNGTTVEKGCLLDRICNSS